MLNIRRSMAIHGQLLCFLICLPILSNQARSATSNLCDHAAAIVAKESGVPLKILEAVSRTETGRRLDGRLEPWPWAINIEGKGIWLDSKTLALGVVQSRLSTGKQNIDIGCFQLNYRWHGNAFSSISEMLDPLENARYAAEFLSELFDEKGDWTSAVGAYHSRTEENAARYQRRFAEVFAKLSTPNASPNNIHVQPRRKNHFPLLKKSSRQPLRGSLVPLDSNTRGPMFWRKTGKS